MPRAAAILDLAPRKDVGFGAFCFQTFEEHADLYASVVSLKVKRGRILLRRKVELEGVWLAKAGSVVDEALALEGLSRGQVDLVVPAQVSPGFSKQLPQAIGFAPEKVLDLTAELGDTLTTSVFLALERALAAGRLGEGKRALLLAFGSGVTVAAANYCF